MNNLYFRTLLISFIALSMSLQAQEQVVFNKIWTTTTRSGNGLTDISELSGTGFKVVSEGATFTGSGNDVNGTLYYVNNGSVFTVPGKISGVFKASGVTNAFYFSNTANTIHYVLVVPGREARFAAGDDPNFNASSPLGDLDTFKTAQQNSVTVSIADASIVTESSSDTYATFSLVFSKSRTASGDNVTFTPSITNTTTSSSDFSTGTIQYLNNTTWTNATSGITVAGNVNSVSLRIQIADDTRPEVNETFVLNTGAFTGSGATQVQNSAGTYAVGTIADNNDPLVWTGTSNTSFGTSSNWNPNDLSPSADYSISIPSGITNYPEVGSNTSIKDLVIQSGAKITINNNAVLSVKGNVSNDGQSLGEGTLEMSGSSAQTISGTGDYKSLKIDNASGVSISNSAGTMVNMIGVLSINNGQLTTNGKLTLKSTATDEGILGTVNCSNPAASINGNVTVERLIPGNQRAFRFLTPGVNTTGTIRDNWQEGQNNTSTVYANYLNNTPGYGTHITGSTTGANGFDATLTGNPSLFTYDNGIQTWASLGSTNNVSSDLMKYGEAYRILIRGSRATNMNSNTPTPDATTIRTTGELCYCDATFNTTGSGTNAISAVRLSATDNTWSFIGNPYWAYVDWHAVTKNNISNTYYVWDPTIAGTNGRGGFEAWIYNPSTNSGQKQNGSNSRLDRYIQPGQAFFVKTTGSSPSLTFEEADKYTASNGRKAIFSSEPPSFSADIPLDNVQPAVGENRISVLLYLKENVDKKAADAATLFYANGWSDDLGVDDADKLNNPDENIALSRGAKNFAFEGKSPLSNLLSDSVDLKLWNLNARSYVLRINAKDYAAQHEIFLVDKLKGTEHKVNKGSVLDLLITPVTGQRTLDNFYLVLRKPVLEFPSTQVVAHKGLKVYPNPVSSQLNLSLGSDIELQENSKLLISDFNGQRLLNADIDVTDGNSFSVDVSALTAGTYIVELISGKRRYTHKIIKK